MKKITSIFLTLIFCMSMVFSTSAAPVEEFVIDELGCLTEEELDYLNDLAADIYDASEIGIFFVFTEQESLADYNIDSLVKGITNYVVMLENENSWYTFYGGRGENIDTEQELELRGIYDETETYLEGVEAFLYAVDEAVPYIADTPEGDILEMPIYCVYDDADLLSDLEEEELSTKLLTISDRYGAEVVVVTVPEVNSSDIDSYTEYVYDSMDYGYGEQKDGVMLLLCMETRDYRILSIGFAGEAIGIEEGEAIGEAIVPNLSAGFYSAAFDEFADQTEYYLNGYLNGFPFAVMEHLATALIIGIIAGLIVAFVLKGQLKTVRKQNQANVYVKKESMQITNRAEFFLYRDIKRVKKESSNKSSGSGSSRSVSGGKF